MTTTRDGLPWRHDPRPPLAVAPEAGMQVICDLNPYDPRPDLVGRAARCAQPPIIKAALVYAKLGSTAPD